MTRWELLAVRSSAVSEPTALQTATLQVGASSVACGNAHMLNSTTTLHPAYVPRTERHRRSWPARMANPPHSGRCSLRADRHPGRAVLPGDQGGRAGAVQVGLMDRAEVVDVGPVDVAAVHRHSLREVLPGDQGGHP